MSITTDALDAIKQEIGAAAQAPTPELQIESLIWAVEGLANLVEKLHARVLFLEQQQQRRENY